MKKSFEVKIYGILFIQGDFDMSRICFLTVVFSLSFSSGAFGASSEEIIDLSSQILLLLEGNIDDVDRSGKKKIYRSLIRTLNVLEDEGVSIDQNSEGRVACVPTGVFDRTIVTRISNGQTIGEHFDSPSECGAALNNKKNGLICLPTGVFERTVVTKISNGQALGSHFDSLEECMPAVQNNRNGLVCVPTGVFDRTIMTNVSNGQTVGQHFDSLNQCLSAL